MLKNLSVGKKFNLLLILVFISGVTLSGVAFSAILNRNVEHQVAGQADLLMQAMISVRKYTNQQVNPLLAGRVNTEPQFLPQTVPAYSAREVFEYMRTNSEYKNFFYKEATLNPTNLRDKADNFEAQLVENFRKNPSRKELTGYRTVASNALFYIAQPLTITEQSCLRCHSTPEAAPKSQIASYGSENGFGWKLNEIIGAQIISVPASDIIETSRRSFLLFMGIVAGAFALAILLINLLLKQAVIQPINRIVKVANDVSMGNMNAEFEHKSNDEIGMLSTAFNRMKISIAMAMDMLKQKNN